MMHSEYTKNQLLFLNSLEKGGRREEVEQNVTECEDSSRTLENLKIECEILKKLINEVKSDEDFQKDSDIILLDNQDLNRIVQHSKQLGKLRAVQDLLTSYFRMYAFKKDIYKEINNSQINEIFKFEKYHREVEKKINFFRAHRNFLDAEKFEDAQKKQLKNFQEALVDRVENILLNNKTSVEVMTAAVDNDVHKLFNKSTFPYVSEIKTLLTFLEGNKEGTEQITSSYYKTKAYLIMVMIDDFLDNVLKTDKQPFTKFKKLLSIIENLFFNEIELIKELFNNVDEQLLEKHFYQEVFVDNIHVKLTNWVHTFNKISSIEILVEVLLHIKQQKNANGIKTLVNYHSLLFNEVQSVLCNAFSFFVLDYVNGYEITRSDLVVFVEAKDEFVFTTNLNIYLPPVRKYVNLMRKMSKALGDKTLTSMYQASYAILISKIKQAGESFVRFFEDTNVLVRKAALFKLKHLEYLYNDLPGTEASVTLEVCDNRSVFSYTGLASYIKSFIRAETVSVSIRSHIGALMEKECEGFVKNILSRELVSDELVAVSGEIKTVLCESKLASKIYALLSEKLPGLRR